MGLFDKLKQGLSKTKTAIFGEVKQLFKNMRKVDEELMEELEEMPSWRMSVLHPRKRS